MSNRWKLVIATDGSATRRPDQYGGLSSRKNVLAWIPDSGDLIKFRADQHFAQMIYSVASAVGQKFRRWPLDVSCGSSAFCRLGHRPPCKCVAYLRRDKSNGENAHQLASVPQRSSLIRRRIPSRRRGEAGDLLFKGIDDELNAHRWAILLAVDDRCHCHGVGSGASSPAA